ncbi:glycoside hydrolase family 18 protein [Siphonobacter curvatus]|uniref:chitinase n=1 Tax=Siphonobacter curvatus TaxID=2094562 RepID=A0A2S7ILA4_9BACT|nr:glycoside hydrolase family 18 protein [Siphonobacter curvatus]PQA58408.1 chitinase [Siphonobacter curvatus]
MHKPLRLTLFFLLLASLAFGQSKKYVVIGYVTGGGWTKESLEADAKKMTHINFAFAVPNEAGVLAPLNQRDVKTLKALDALRSVNKDLKLLISIGGWGGCKYFSDVSVNEPARQKFAKSCMKLLNEYHLDGVDIDWEYPAQVGAGNIFRPEDKQNYTLLLKTLREHLDAQEKKNKRLKSNPYLLTSATGGDTAFVSHTELGKAAKYLDYVNIMTYDLYHGNDVVTGHHSPLYQSKLGDYSRNSSDDAVKGHVKAGVPISKIVLGVPFYGRGWTNVKPEQNGLFQPTTDTKHSFTSYTELTNKYINKNGYTRHWDEASKVPYLWNPETKSFISYCDEESMQYKMDYIKKQGMAGVMYWEYQLDMPGKKLLDSVVEGLK